MAVQCRFMATSYSFCTLDSGCLHLARAPRPTMRRFPLPPAPTVAPYTRRVTLRLQTQDVRKYLLTDTVRRTTSAMVRAGATPVRTLTPPKRIKRWCVLRSPHVNKTSREHFWMHTHSRIMEFDLPTTQRAAPFVVVRNLPRVAARVQENSPGLALLRQLWDGAKAGAADKGSKTTKANKETVELNA